MISQNLRHLRLLVAVGDTASLTKAADRLFVSQPAVTQAIRKLEDEAGGPLFDRTPAGLFATPRGAILIARLKRAFALLDPALTDVSPRLRLTATTTQLRALAAVRETENFTLAARKLGVAQPTVHRAVSQLEKEAGRQLFERTSYGVVATRQTRHLVQALMLAFTELAQAQADLDELDGGGSGRVVIGALPLARSVLLPKALTRFRTLRPREPIKVIDGLYGELLAGLRRGDIDVIVGALRDPAPIGDIVQERLFDDRLTVLAGNHHPLVECGNVSRSVLKGCAWVVPRQGAPSRGQFDDFFAATGAPEQIIEAGSILFMREILANSDHLGCISRAQAQAEVANGLVSEIAVDAQWPRRPIGLTYRASWVPTQVQKDAISQIRSAVSDLGL